MISHYAITREAARADIRRIWSGAVWIFDWYLRLEWAWKLGLWGAVTGATGTIWAWLQAQPIVLWPYYFGVAAVIGVALAATILFLRNEISRRQKPGNGITPVARPDGHYPLALTVPIQRPPGLYPPATSQPATDTAFPFGKALTLGPPYLSLKELVEHLTPRLLSPQKVEQALRDVLVLGDLHGFGYAFDSRSGYQSFLSEIPAAFWRDAVIDVPTILNDAFTDEIGAREMDLDELLRRDNSACELYKGVRFKTQEVRDIWTYP